MEDKIELTAEQVKADDKMLDKIVRFYNSRRNLEIQYRNKNKEKLNEYARNYYHQLNKTDEVQKEKKTENLKEYQKQYRTMLKEKREKNKIKAEDISEQIPVISGEPHIGPK